MLAGEIRAQKLRMGLEEGALGNEKASRAQGMGKRVGGFPTLPPKLVKNPPTYTHPFLFCFIWGNTWLWHDLKCRAKSKLRAQPGIARYIKQNKQNKNECELKFISKANGFGFSALSHFSKMLPRPLNHSFPLASYKTAVLGVLNGNISRSPEPQKQRFWK